MARPIRATPSSVTGKHLLRMLQPPTVERTRLLKTVRTKHLSMSALTVLLKREPKSVRRDVKKLEEYGIVRLREQISPRHGRVKTHFRQKSAVRRAQ